MERACCNPPPIVGGPALASIVGVWILVTSVRLDPSIVLLVLPPTTQRLIWSYDDLTPLYLLLVPAWAGSVHWLLEIGSLDAD